MIERNFWIRTEEEEFEIGCSIILTLICVKILYLLI
jgi:hypothetical protein